MFILTGQGSPAQVQDLLLAHRGNFFLPAAEETALYDFDHERCRLFLAHLRIKSASVEKTSVRLETFSLNAYQSPQAFG